jgi:predicted DNA-binding transcriptional regulator AlpA
MLLLRFADLKSQGIIQNWTTLKRWQETEDFPSSIKLGPNTTVWLKSEIDAWLASRPRQKGGE